MREGDFLASYGPWDAETFLRCLPGQHVTLAVVLVQSEGTGAEARSDVGQAVHTVWRRVLDAFPGGHGHRLAWSDLAFLLPGPSPEATIEPMCEALRTAEGSSYGTLAALTSVSASYEDRLSTLDDLGWRTAKIDYRQEYPDAWCIRGGSVVHRPLQLPRQ